MKNFIIVSVFALAFAACSSNECLSPIDLTRFVADPENNLTKRREVAGLEIQVSLRPTDLIISRELRNEQSDERVKLLREKYDQYYYFIVSFSTQGREALQANTTNYSSLVDAMSFRMNEFISLAGSNDPISPVDFIIDRTYGMSNATNIMVVFNKKDLSGSVDEIEFNIKEFGLGLGNQSFQFDKRDFENIPKVNFQLQSGISQSK
jgi:hypothetical protein